MQAGLHEVPCWVRLMTDEDAYMALVLENTQSELLPLEEGMHALGSELSQRAYAQRAGMRQTTLVARRQAAAVASACSDIGTQTMAPYWQALNTIHSAPEWLWGALVERLLKDTWTVDAGLQHDASQGGSA
jgi:hypothetical protein